MDIYPVVRTVYLLKRKNNQNTENKVFFSRRVVIFSDNIPRPRGSDAILILGTYSGMLAVDYREGMSWGVLTWRGWE